METIDIYDKIMRKLKIEISLFENDSIVEHYSDPRRNYRFLVSTYRSGSHWFIYIVQLILSGATNTDPVRDENYVIESIGAQIALDATRKMMAPEVTDGYADSSTSAAPVGDGDENTTTSADVGGGNNKILTFLKVRNFFGFDNSFSDNPSARTVLLMRNPKDVFNAFYHGVDGMSPVDYNGTRIGQVIQYDLFLDYWLSDRFQNMYGFFEFQKHFWRYRSAHNFQIMLYEDMVRDPRRAIETIARFLGDKYAERLSHVLDDNTGETLLDRIERLSSIGAMKPVFSAQDPWRVRKGAIGDWRLLMSREQSDAFDRKIAAEWDGTGLEMLWEQDMKWHD